jgi:hypothetical protein
MNVSVRGVQGDNFNTFYEEEDDEGVLKFVCRGDDGCGVSVYSEDRERHARSHARIEGMLTSLEQASSS